MVEHLELYLGLCLAIQIVTLLVVLNECAALRRAIERKAQ